MSILDVLIGRPLANWEEHGEQIGPSAGIPIFGLDALSSAAYGPEAALTLLIPLGLLGVHYILPVVAAIVVLLTIVYFSYRQTIEAYPQGGGSYTVASENLGPHIGLLAAAALDDRLRADSGRGHLRRRRGAYLGPAGAATAYARHLPADSVSSSPS